MKNLIGRKFRRNVYGLSIWEDAITEVDVAFKFFKPIPKQLVFNIETYEEYKKHGFIPEFKIRGSEYWYNISEIVVY